MIDHAYQPHPKFSNRDACDLTFEDEGRAAHCGRPANEHGGTTLPVAIETPREGEPGDAETYEGKPLFEKGPQEPAPARKRWPRKVGWTKLQERRARCNHALGGEVVVTFYQSDCPRCLADQSAYWKARARSAEGAAASEKARADMLALEVAAIGSVLLDVQKDCVAEKKRGAAFAESIDVVFDGPPSSESGRFVEVEDRAGLSIKIGEWIDRGNGLWALRIPSVKR